jgi:hypothetical protein
MPRSNIHAELVGVPEFEGTLDEIGRHVFPTANSRAINLVARKMRTLMVRAVAKEMGVKQKAVRTRTKLTKARKAVPRALLEFRGRAFNLIEFKARQTKEGVTAKPWGKRRKIPHAFIATMPQGGRIVVIRALRSGGRVGRLPIEAWLGPGVAKTAAAEGMEKERVKIMRDVYPAELRRQLDLLTKKAIERRARKAAR